MKKQEKWVESEVVTKQGIAKVYHPAGHPPENFLKVLDKKLEFPMQNGKKVINEKGVAFSTMGKRKVVLKPITVFDFEDWDVVGAASEFNAVKKRVALLRHLNKNNAPCGVPIAVIHFPFKDQSASVHRARTFVVHLKHSGPTLKRFLESSANLKDKINAGVSAFRLLGRLHALGYVHSDPHDENLLIVNKKIRLIDGHGVTKANAVSIAYDFDSLMYRTKQFSEHDRNKFRLAYHDSFEKANASRIS